MPGSFTPSVELTPGKAPLNSRRIIVDTREPWPHPWAAFLPWWEQPHPWQKKYAAASDRQEMASSTRGFSLGSR